MRTLEMIFTKSRRAEGLCNNDTIPMKKFVLGLLLLISIGCQPLLAQKKADAKAVLDAMSEKFRSYKGFSASFEFAYQDEMGSSELQKGEILVQGEKYRLKLPGQEIYNDGQTVWTYIESAGYREVTINDVSQTEGELIPSTIYRLYESGYDYRLINGRILDDKEIQTVEMNALNSEAPFSHVKLMIEKETKDLVGWELMDGQGGMYSYLLKNVTARGELEESDFSFDPNKHPGIEIIDLR